MLLLNLLSSCESLPLAPQKSGESAGEGGLAAGDAEEVGEGGAQGDGEGGGAQVAEGADGVGCLGVGGGGHVVVWLGGLEDEGGVAGVSEALAAALGGEELLELGHNHAVGADGVEGDAAVGGSCHALHAQFDGVGAVNDGLHVQGAAAGAVDGGGFGRGGVAVGDCAVV